MFCSHPFSITNVALITKNKITAGLKANIFKFIIVIKKIDIKIHQKENILANKH